MKKIILIFLVIIICISVQSSYAKYQSNIKGKVTSTIAEPIVEMKTTEKVVLTAIKPKQNYSFSIQNYNKFNKINEVKMKYAIEFIYAEKNTTLELYKGEEKIEIKDKKTCFFTLGIKEKQEDAYLLKIQYNQPEEREEKDIEDEIQIKMYSIQER